MKELERFKNKYMSLEQNVKYNFDEDECRNVLQYIFKSTPFEHPDAFFVDGDTLYIIEHFEYDSSEFKKHMGSIMRVQDNEFNKKMELTIGFFSAQYNTNSSIKNYCLNFLRSFNKHVNQNDKYLNDVSKKLNKSFKNIKYIYVAEDNSILGTSTFFAHKLELVFPIYIPEILEIINKSNADYMLFSNIYGNDKFLYMYKNNYNDDKLLKMNSDIKILFNSPLAIGYNIKLK